MDEDTRKSAKEKVRLDGCWEGSRTEGSSLRETRVDEEGTSFIQ